MSILKKIVACKMQEVEVRKVLVPEKELVKSAYFKRKCLSLKKNLQDDRLSGIIAEFKRKTPSKSFTNPDADIKIITGQFKKYKASAISIATDKKFFGGSAEDLVIARENKIPIIRMDYIIDPYQLLVSKAIGADVVMLTAACLTKKMLKELTAFSKKLGMEVILEVRNEKELGYLTDEVDIISVNNHNLKNFDVDLKKAEKLGKMIPEGVLKIAGGGIQNIKTVHTLINAGYAGCMIGELFMKEKDPGKSFANFAALQ